MNIPARTEVMLDEIRLDVTEFLRQFVGCDNTPDLRTVVAQLITSYLYGFEEIKSAIVICDETNNSRHTIDCGEFHAQSIFVIGNQSFCGLFSVYPGMNGYNPDIEIVFHVRRELNDQPEPEVVVEKAEPERRVFYVDVGNATFNIDALRNDLMARMIAAIDPRIPIELEKEVKNQYEEMPESLINALKV